MDRISRMKNDCLETPAYIYKSLGPFDLDPCAGIKTEIGSVNYSIDRSEDGLLLKWKGFIFCNPPFSEKQKWIDKMVAHNNGILLLPERGSAPWFGPLALAAGNYFVMGEKINFIGGHSSNNVGSCLFPFGLEAINRLLDSKLPGHFNVVKCFTKRGIWTG